MNINLNIKKHASDSLTRSKAKTNSRVLIVEDDLDLVTVLETVLQSIDRGIELDWATSAENAIIQLKNSNNNSTIQNYDLIIADIFLDGESTGIDLWNKCHEFCIDVPIIIMSSLPTHKYFAALGQQAISPPFLTKPLVLNECKQLFESMLNYNLINKRLHK